MKRTGFVYVVANAYISGLVKIGCTKKSPYYRADELSRFEGVPCGFDVMGYIECEDWYQIEKRVHIHLRKFWVGKEFFEIGIHEALAALNRFGCVIEGSAKDRMRFENGIRGSDVLIQQNAEECHDH